MSASMRVPMLDLRREYAYMKADIDAAIRRCLDHQKWILGPEVAELEEKAADYLGVRHTIGTSSGTDALVLALRALAIKTKDREYFDKGDQIITTSFTFTATGDAILRAGATPVFVDIDPDSYNIDPDRIRQYLVRYTQGARAGSAKVVGIIPVHLYGQACDMDEITAIAKEFGLFVLEDVAQAFGGSHGNRKLGSIGTCGAFSFFPSKNLGGFGDGGLLSTNDGEIAEISRMLLKHGGRDKYDVEHIGYNARLDTLQAAVLLAKLTYIDEFNGRRKHVGSLYAAELRKTEGIVVPLSRTASDHVFHQFTIRVLHGRRDALRSSLKESGIESMVYYPVPLTDMKVFHERCVTQENMAVTKRAPHEVLSLPMEPLMEDEEVLSVVRAVRDFQVTGHSA